MRTQRTFYGFHEIQIATLAVRVYFVRKLSCIETLKGRERRNIARKSPLRGHCSAGKWIFDFVSTSSKHWLILYYKPAALWRPQQVCAWQTFAVVYLWHHLQSIQLSFLGKHTTRAEYRRGFHP